MPKWLLPTLSEVLALNDPTWTVCYGALSAQGINEENQQRQLSSRATLKQARAEREWRGAIAALSIMLYQSLTPTEATGETSESQPQGLVLSGPFPVLSHPALVNKLTTWTLGANSLQAMPWMPLQLLPAISNSESEVDTPPVLPLLPGDPLATERFCLVLMPTFSLVMVLGENLAGEPAFMVSFLPQVVKQAWEALRPRILLMRSQQIEPLDQFVQQLEPTTPDYETVMQFNRLVLENLPDPIETVRPEFSREPLREREPVEEQPSVRHQDGIPVSPCSAAENPSPDMELLQAIAHEVRTPLTTIRTLTRSLLKRTDLPAAAIKRLQAIDRECSEQIDRFGLFFRAVELETSASRQSTMPLTRTSLAQVFQQSIPRWQQQASQRQLTLDVVVPQKMPMVVSDPTMLDQALTSLIERFTRSLPTGSHIRVEVMLAGDQLKLQLQSQADPVCQDAGNVQHFQGYRPSVKSLGQLLMFQPETGSLSLNLAVTKNLFQALGGKLIVRQRPQQGEVMTVFLPLEVDYSLDIHSPDIVEV